MNTAKTDTTQKSTTQALEKIEGDLARLVVGTQEAEEQFIKDAVAYYTHKK